MNVENDEWRMTNGASLQGLVLASGVWARVGSDLVVLSITEGNGADSRRLLRNRGVLAQGSIFPPASTRFNRF